MNGQDKCSRFKLGINGLDEGVWPKQMGLVLLGANRTTRWCKWDKV